VAFNLAAWGNALHSGEKSYGIVRRRKWWLSVSAVFVALSVASLVGLIGNGVNPGIDFRGGSSFTVSGVSTTDLGPAQQVVAELAPDQVPVTQLVTTGGVSTIRVEIGKSTDPTIDDATVSRDIEEALAVAYGTTAKPAQVSKTFVGANWGADVTSKALKGLGIFIVLVMIVMSVYFRAWRMAAAALVALAHDLVFTVGVYAAVGFEVTPASVIGFLTILGYSLYDTVVVFDKVRENTANVTSQTRYTYDELANLAVNQTLVRSLNTSIVALLPVTSILFVGAILLGAGTLKDISLALFVGMAVGTYSSIFVATPMEVALRDREPRIRQHTAAVLAARAAGHGAVDADGNVRVGALVKGEHRGTAAQPKRKRRS
jgi:preprotein translocase subunit SecF